MYYISEFCYVCMKYEKKMCRLSDFGANNITYYRQLLSILPELNKETMNQFRHICEKCSQLLDTVYTFHNRCLTNVRIFENYLLLLRSTGDVTAKLTVVLNDVKSNAKALSSPKATTDLNSENIHVDIDNEHNKIGPMEDIEIKTEAGDIALDIVKHELPRNETKCETCIDMEDNNSAIDNNLSDITLIPPILENDEANRDKSKYLNKYENIDPVYDNEESYEKCEKRFTDNLTVHKQTRNQTKQKQRECQVKTPYECEICKKSFTGNTSFTRHKRIHTGEKPFACNLCEKRFNQSGHLNVHKRIHTGEKPLLCNVCEKRFCRNSDLIAHKRIHLNEKPFECNICEKGFSHISNLIAHKRTHTGEKPFECNICQKRFNRSNSLITHKLIHTKEKPFECNICEKKFTQGSHLIVHKRIHTGESI